MFRNIFGTRTIKSFLKTNYFILPHSQLLIHTLTVSTVFLLTKAHVSFRGTVSGDMVICITLAHLSTTMYLQCWIHCSCKNMYALYPVTDKVFSLSFTTLHVISGAITLVLIVFFLESRSDTVC